MSRLMNSSLMTRLVTKLKAYSFFGLTIWGWTLCRSVFFIFLFSATNLLFLFFLAWVWVVWERRDFLLIRNHFFTILELSLNCWRVCSNVLTVGRMGLGRCTECLLGVYWLGSLVMLILDFLLLRMREVVKSSSMLLWFNDINETNR